ncbi:hypothetical protein GW17_00009923 [Ensete ventricosum]|nr:hypothetical protein GW17_00009923 [Ensete ventricosum]
MATSHSFGFAASLLDPGASPKVVTAAAAEADAFWSRLNAAAEYAIPCSSKILLLHLALSPRKRYGDVIYIAHDAGRIHPKNHSPILVKGRAVGVIHIHSP